MMLLFNVVVLAYGIYTIYAAIMVKKTQKLNAWFLGKNQRTVRDEIGYIDYIYGRTITMGAVVLLFGAVQIVDMYGMKIPAQIMGGIILLLLTVFIWFYISMSKAKKKFW